MKRFTAILLLLVLLFNLCGYRVVIDYLQRQHEQKFTAQLDNEQYNDADLISIKTPLSLPYYNAKMDFERVDGSIEINGVTYNYVKRRIVSDSLELLCLPNAGKQKLQTAKSDFFKLSNDLRTENNKKSANIIKTVLPEFCNALTAYNFGLRHAARQLHPVVDQLFYSRLFTATPEQPPETMRLS